MPQLYVRQLSEGDFQASGALLAGNRVNLQIQEDLVNAGGRIEGDVVVAEAGRDLANIGGLMQARSELLAKAGRHVTISSPTHTTSFEGNYVNQTPARRPASPSTSTWAPTKAAARAPSQPKPAAPAAWLAQVMCASRPRALERTATS